MQQQKELQEHHEAFQHDRLVQNGMVPIVWENLQDYDLEGAEPEGMQVSVVEQPGEECSLDQALFVQWMDERLKLQLNLATKLLLLPVLEEQATEAEAALTREEFFATCLADGRAWTALCLAVHQAKRGKEASPGDKAPASAVTTPSAAAGTTASSTTPASAVTTALTQPDSSHLLATDVETWFG